MSLPPYIPAAPGRVGTVLRTLDVWALNQWISSDPLTSHTDKPPGGAGLEAAILWQNLQLDSATVCKIVLNSCL